MEAFKSIPKILEDIEDINRNGNSAQALTEYRRNLKEFIKSVTKEVGEIIDRYEKKIATLKEENQRLRLKTDQSRGLPVETAAKKS
jgi:F0F1-type ATP synthase membrane subunit b/b'